MSQLPKKRSNYVALVLMAPLAGGALQGCSERPVEALAFHDVAECHNFGADLEACADAFDEARFQHTQLAPRYINQAECEADFGAEACEATPERHQAGSFFMPMMMGFLAGQLMGRMGGGQSGGQAGLQSSTPAAAGGAAPAGGSGAARVPVQPLYKSRDDRQTFRTATNTPVANRPGAVQVRPSAVQPRAAPLIRQGGFGQQAAQRMSSRSSFGG